MNKLLCHKTKSGEPVNLTDLTDEHLLNIINKIERKAKEGVVIEHEYDLPDAYTGVYEEILKGGEVLDRFNYNSYLEEAFYRKLLTKEEIELRLARNWLPFLFTNSKFNNHVKE